MGKRRKMVDTSVPESEIERGPSRAERRQARRAEQSRLERLGLTLCELPDGALARLRLEEALEIELRKLATMSRGDALPRQRRRVASLLRERDLEELERELEAITGTGRGRTATTARLEHLRRTLVAGGNDELQALFRDRPDLDRQSIGRAVRAARKEAARGEGNARFKELYVALREAGLGRDPDDASER